MVKITASECNTLMTGQHTGNYHLTGKDANPTSLGNHANYTYEILTPLTNAERMLFIWVNPPKGAEYQSWAAHSFICWMPVEMVMVQCVLKELCTGLSAFNH